MSTKASSTTASSSTASTNSTTTTAGVVKIKSELPSDEIKEFAENTMNELLGWYGFDGVDRLDLSAKTTRLLQSAANTNPLNHHPLEKRRSRNRAATLLQLQQQQQQNHRSINNNNNSRNNNNNNNINHNNNNNNKSSNITTNSFRAHSIAASIDESTSDHDTRSSREDDSKSPHSAGKTLIDEKIDFNNCCWCRRPIPENAPEFLTTTDGPRYCSESCFTQSRRASFKKAKTCDWCKHVRHAVSYVDFQDGASQLQFCSDKCLNQYKMQIFCKETQAHLDMNPHLREQGLEAAASGNSAGLITPDLWLRNCRSRSASPASTLSASPGPITSREQPTPAATTTSKARALSPPPLSQTPATANTTSSGGGVHKPMISVAPASKLMSKNPATIMNNRQSPKHSRKKRMLKSCMDSEPVNVSMKSNHNSLRREVGNLSAAGASQLLGNSKLLLGVNKSNSLRTSPGGHNASTRVSPAPKISTPSLSQFVASSVQDLHMSVPPLSPMLDQQQSHSTLSHHANVSGRGTSIPPAFFATPPSVGQQPAPPQFPTRPPFLQNPVMGGGGLPRFMGSMGFPHFTHHGTMQPDMMSGGFPGLLGTTPPVTVMVPYPIIIPLPIPIPIPLPIIDFYKAHFTPEQRELFKREELEKRTEVKQKQEDDNEESSLQVDSNCNTTEEPLDFTKSKDLTGIQQENTTSTNSLDVENHDSVTSNQMIEQDAHSIEHIDPLSTSVETTETTTQLEKYAEEQVTHCIVPSSTSEKLPENANIDANVGNDRSETPNSNQHQMELENDDAKQKLPKFKITRLHTKRTLIQQTTKESECSRPLRKRKRIIDCDFQKIALTKEGDDEALDNNETTPLMSSNAMCNSQTKVSNSRK